MTRHQNCPEESSSSSSSSSSDIPYTPCQKLCAQDIYKVFRNAVVSIRSEFILLAPGIDPTIVPSTPLGISPAATNGSNQRTDVILSGNGFFIPGHFIVCPASLILLPPTINGAANRYPYSLTKGYLTTPGPIDSQMISASRILVTVYNVNGRKQTFTYQAQIVGVDGAGDIAMLRIDYDSIYNIGAPCLHKKEHPYFMMRDSREACPGERIYVMGSTCTSSEIPYQQENQRSIVEGIISENKFLESQGWILPECIVIDANVYSPNTGNPIIDCYGRILGMQTTALIGNRTGHFNNIVPFEGFYETGSTGSIGEPLQSLQNYFFSSDSFGAVMGPTSNFMSLVLRAFLKGNCRFEYQRHLEYVNDNANGYYRYMKGYAGIAYRRVDNLSYDATYDYSLVANDTIYGAPRVRLDQNGNFVGVPDCKLIGGIQVMALAGDNGSLVQNQTSGLYSVPGYTNCSSAVVGAIFSGIVEDTSTNGTDLVDSPFLGLLYPGDIIVAAGTDESQVQIGGLTEQTTLSNVTWRLNPNDLLRLVIRRGNNVANNLGTNSNTNVLQENYSNSYTIVQPLQKYPQLMDYPWYNVGLFWNVLAPPAVVSNIPPTNYISYPPNPTSSIAVPAPFTPFPFFPVANNNQSVNPQLPQGVNGEITGFFHPAL